MGHKDGPSSLVVLSSFLFSLAALVMSVAALWLATNPGALAPVKAHSAKKAGAKQEADEGSRWRRIADSAAELEDKVREGETGASLQQGLEKLRMRIAEARESAAPVVAARLKELGQILDRVSVAVRDQAKDLPQRLSELAESARDLYERYRQESDTAKKLEQEETPRP